jgi:DNA-binding transcriptional ArsR family regulator
MAYLDALGALSDPTRRKVFEAVAVGGRSVTQIADELPISRPAVSQLRAYLDRFWDGALGSYVREAHRKES